MGPLLWFRTWDLRPKMAVLSRHCKTDWLFKESVQSPMKASPEKEEWLMMMSPKDLQWGALVSSIFNYWCQTYNVFLVSMFSLTTLTLTLAMMTKWRWYLRSQLFHRRSGLLSLGASSPRNSGSMRQITLIPPLHSHNRAGRAAQALCDTSYWS